MALSDFLNNGEIPSGSAVKSMTSQTVLPDWYTNYAMQILSNQQALMGRPYETAPMPRVAGFTKPQEEAFDATRASAFAYQPSMAAATTATQNLMGQDTASAAQPYFRQALDLSPSGTAASDFGTARNLVTQAGNVDLRGAAQPYVNQATATSGLSAAQPYLGSATDLTKASTGALGMQSAQPFLEAAGQRATDVSAYMNPYTEQVVSRIADLGARNLRETIMPEIEGRYVRAGQLGFGPRGGGAGTPSGMLTDTARAIRDVQGDILAQQSGALQQGFTQAQGAAQADLARQAQLASTAGGLGTQQQQALAQAGQQLGALGTTAGSLTGQQQQLLADIAGRMGTLAGAEQQGALSAAQQFAGLGAAGAGLTKAQQELLASVGAQTAGLRGQDITRQLGAAEQLAGLGGRTQEMGLTGAGALSQIGGQQQALNQRNLDLAYEDFLRQQGYPQEQINNALATLKGIQGAVPAATTEEGITPSGVEAKYAPSTAATIGGALTGIGGVLAGAQPGSALSKLLGLG